MWPRLGVTARCRPPRLNALAPGPPCVPLRFTRQQAHSGAGGERPAAKAGPRITHFRRSTHAPGLSAPGVVLVRRRGQRSDVPNEVADLALVEGVAPGRHGGRQPGDAATRTNDGGQLEVGALALEGRVGQVPRLRVEVVGVEAVARPLAAVAGAAVVLEEGAPLPRTVGEVGLGQGGGRRRALGGGGRGRLGDGIPRPRGRRRAARRRRGRSR